MPRMERSPWRYEIARGSAFNRDGVFSVSVREECVLGTHRTTSRLFVSSLDARSTRKVHSKRNRLPLSLLNHAWYSDNLSASDSVTPGIYSVLFRVSEKGNYAIQKDMKNMWCFWKYGIKIATGWIIGAIKRLIYVTGIHRTTSLLEFQWTETLTRCDKSYESRCMYIHYKNSYHVYTRIWVIFFSMHLQNIWKNFEQKICRNVFALMFWINNQFTYC